ncbi:MAG TPA: UDP-N-acetylmuramoyl-L-alanine--D-glutamate ligase [Burkholderiales bacterium]|nr:UDP-N-acetylmuramoyl-L-alanine--D-glutamate ligase [Burkholderiales bacterium]
MPLELENRRVLVLGLGSSGMSMARWLAGRGARVHVADSRPVPPNADQLREELPDIDLHTGAFRPESFADAELIAISPGVPLAEPLVQAALARGLEVIGDIELFARVRDEFPGAKVIGITGSNGKSTVTEMVGTMTRAARTRTLVAGNIGLPILEALWEIEAGRRRRPDVFVLELSSFQLETTENLNVDAGTVLNLSEDHLDRYAGIREYAQAKARIFFGNGAQVINREDAWAREMAASGRRVFTFGLDEPREEGAWGLRNLDGELWLAEGRANLMKVSELKVTGLHNAANALAALALCRAVGFPYEALLDALFSFSGLPHRVQRIVDINGVAFFDDSKGTNVGATVAALEAMGRKVVLIAGGDGKGQDFSPLRDAVARHARAVVLIGRDRDRIAAAIESTGVVLVRASDMHEAVRATLALAHAGDAVLLSPACASFDMFRDYEHRAQVFVDEVRALEGAQ